MITLAEGARALGVALSADNEQRLLAWRDLLAKWNRVHNLTAVRAPAAMVTHHLLDSLAVLPWLDQTLTPGRPYRLCDVGSGAGLPGMVLAIVRPDWLVTSIEVVGKKVAFQRQAKLTLKLDNFEIVHGRAQNVADRFDAVISRALAALADYVAMAGHLADRLWAMKGEYPAAEVAALPAPWRLAAHHPLTVPGLTAQRCLLRLDKA